MTPTSACNVSCNMPVRQLVSCHRYGSWVSATDGEAEDEAMIDAQQATAPKKEEGEEEHSMIREAAIGKG